MSNAEIKKLIKDNNIFMWQIAKKLKIHESCFSKWFREPLTEEQQYRVLSAIEEIKLSKSVEDDNT